jgi:hypothetical protein
VYTYEVHTFLLDCGLLGYGTLYHRDYQHLNLQDMYVIFFPEDENSKFLRNVGDITLYCFVVQATIQIPTSAKSLNLTCERNTSLEIWDSS